MTTPKHLRRGLLVMGLVAVAGWFALARGSFGPPFEPDDETDRGVYEVVLDHFANHEYSDRSYDRSGRKRNRIYLRGKTGGSIGTGPHIPLRGWPCRSQLRESLIERNQSDHALAWRDTATILIGGTEEDSYWSTRELQHDPDFRCYIELARPGYSRSGRMVLVNFYFGPSAHGTDVTYVLVRNGQSWRIVSFDCWFYA